MMLSRRMRRRYGCAEHASRRCAGRSWRLRADVSVLSVAASQLLDSA